MQSNLRIKDFIYLITFHVCYMRFHYYNYFLLNSTFKGNMNNFCTTLSFNTFNVVLFARVSFLFVLQLNAITNCSKGAEYVSNDCTSIKLINYFGSFEKGET